jgi:hypothetical protein
MGCNARETNNKQTLFYIDLCPQNARFLCITYSVPVPVAILMYHSVLLLHVQIGTHDTPNNGTTVYMPSDVRALHAKTVWKSLAQVVRLRTSIQEDPDSHLGRDTNFPGGFFVPFPLSSHVLGYCPKIKPHPVLCTSVQFVLYHYSIIRRSEVWRTAVCKLRLQKKTIPYQVAKSRSVLVCIRHQ